MPKRRRTRRVNGRRVERDILNNLKKYKPRWFVTRFNENRRNPTPADLFISTKKYNIMVEVKATMSQYIQKANIRSNQVDSLRKFDSLRKTNLSILMLYYKGPRFVMINVDDLDELRYRISYEDAKAVGIEIRDWKKFDNYLTRIAKV